MIQILAVVRFGPAAAAEVELEPDAPGPEGVHMLLCHSARYRKLLNASPAPETAAAVLMMGRLMAEVASAWDGDDAGTHDDDAWDDATRDDALLARAPTAREWRRSMERAGDRIEGQEYVTRFTGTGRRGRIVVLYPRDAPAAGLLGHWLPLALAVRGTLSREERARTAPTLAEWARFYASPAASKTTVLRSPLERAAARIFYREPD